MLKPGRTVCVSILTPGGKFTHVTSGSSLFDAVFNAIVWFRDPYWRGPKPTKDTVFEVVMVGDDRKWRVRAQRVEEWKAALS